MNQIIQSGTLLFLSATFVTAQGSIGNPLLQAHAHNDYLHSRPLADALARGFWSVEADIWLTNGALLVAHDFSQTSNEQTLQKLYLDPLRSLVRTNAALRGAPPFTLLIDVKSEAETTYAALRTVLREYADVLTEFGKEEVRTNKVMIIISGNRAEATMRRESVRHAALDGRLPDLDQNPPVSLVPLISDNWTKYFQWRGAGEMPATERMKLIELVQRTHGQGRRLRLWAAPDNLSGWKELRAAGVDLLNTDRLAEMQVFLRSQ